jgi:hypothetical protein
MGALLGFYRYLYGDTLNPGDTLNTAARMCKYASAASAPTAGMHDTEMAAAAAAAAAGLDGGVDAVPCDRAGERRSKEGVPTSSLTCSSAVRVASRPVQAAIRAGPGRASWRRWPGGSSRGGGAWSAP